MSHAPITRLDPKSLRRKYLVTVGGKTRGRVNTALTTPRIMVESFDTHQAAIILVKNIITYETNATLRPRKLVYSE